MRQAQYTLTPAAVHQHASTLVQTHWQLRDHGPKCRASVLLALLFTAAARYSMPRKNKMSHRPELLDTQLSALISFVKDLSPEARIEISRARYEDEDAHVSIYPPSTMGAEEVQRLETALGERCNDILVDTGLFIIGAVHD